MNYKKLFFLFLFSFLFKFQSLSQLLSNGFYKVEVVNQNPALKAAEGLTFDKNGRGYIWDKRGYVFILETNGILNTTPLLDIKEEVANFGDNGLNGFALDPDFLTNGYIYAGYSVDRYYYDYFGLPGYDPDSSFIDTLSFGRITRFKADISTNYTTIVPGSRTILLGDSIHNGMPVLYFSHSNGNLVFGNDGSLLAAVGDAAAYTTLDTGSNSFTYWNQGLVDNVIEPKHNVGAWRAQMLTTLSGKILRLDPQTGDGLPSNPFYDTTDARSPQSRIYSLGYRNPFRFSIVKNTGDTDITAGNPGTLILGDVGWSKWEEIDIIKTPGLNAGWPYFEGLATNPFFEISDEVNEDEPNPLYSPGICDFQYFRFRDLLQQESNLNPPFPNPCDSSINMTQKNQSYHFRPTLEWRHNQKLTRTGIFSGGTGKGIPININLANSPIKGEMFEGNAAVGGFVYQTNKVPLEFQNAVFFGDYGEGWIRYMRADANLNIDSVFSFDTTASTIVCLTYNEIDACIYYVSFPDKIYKICYPGLVNNPPVSLPTSDTIYGPSPLTVNFDGTASFDPETGPLTYQWDFADNGAVSNNAIDSHTFSPGPGFPVLYNVTLTVTDTGMLQNTKHLLIHVNNTPPKVDITSPLIGTTYSTSIPTLINMTAQVSDLESPNVQLSYSWKVEKYHNSHTHPECDETDPVTYCILPPEVCLPNDTVWYKVSLTVTDPQGLKGYDFVGIPPLCNVGLNNLLFQQNKEILMFPNPIENDQFDIKFFDEKIRTVNKKDVQIFTSNGDEFSPKNYTFGFNNNSTWSVKLNHLPSGLYFIKINTGTNFVKAKFIKL